MTIRKNNQYVDGHIPLRWLLTGILLLVCSIRTWAAPNDTLRIDKAFQYSTLLGYLHHQCQYTSSPAEASPAYVWSIVNRPGPVLPTEVPMLGNQPITHYLTFRFRNETAEIRFLVLEYGVVNIDDMALYVWSGNRLTKATPGISWRTPTRERDYQHRVPAYLIRTLPGQTYTATLRLRRDGGTLIVPIRLIDEHSFGDLVGRENIRQGIVHGMLTLAIVLGLALALLSGQWLYCFYALYVLGVMGFLLMEGGYINRYGLSISTVLAGPDGWALCSLTGVIAHSWFSILFLQITVRQHPYVVRLSILLSVLCGLVIGWLLVGFRITNNGYVLVIGLHIGYVLLAFSTLFVALRQRKTEAYLYSIAVSVFFTSILLTCLSLFDVLPSNWLLVSLLNFGPLFEVVVLCIGVAYSYQQTQLGRVRALEEAARVRADVVRAADEAQESERKRIAQDLHDDVGNTLAAAKGILGTSGHKLRTQTEFPEIAIARSLLEKASHDLRNISHNLMPVEFSKYTLTDVVRQTVERANAASKGATLARAADNKQTDRTMPHPVVRFEYVQAGNERPLSEERSLVIYRIINELIGNILKHAEARTAVVQLLYQPEYLVITVEDDGKGFKEPNFAVAPSGIGLRNVSSRSNYIGAKLDVSTNRSGTCVILEVPYV